MEAAYYKEYYVLERAHWWFRAREAILAAMIRKYTALQVNAPILNVGAATGRSSEMLSRFGDVSSLEYDADCCAFVRETLHMDLIQGSILELPFDTDRFDLVTAFDVVEHVEDDHLAVQELKRVCSPGGYVFITVPAYMFLWSEHDEVNHHYRRYRAPDIQALFTDGGREVFSSYFNSFLFPPIATFRLFSSLFSGKKKAREDAGSDFFVMNKGSLLQETLFRMFATEKQLLKHEIRFPFGVSYLYLWQNI